MATSRWPPVLVLLMLFVLAYYSLWSLMYRNGYIDAMVQVRESNILPTSGAPLLQKYTGIGPVDEQLTVLQCAFANVVDGSSPPLSLYWFYFAGQLPAVVVLLNIEARRIGNKWTVFSLATTWFLGMQVLGYGLVMPLYCALHLSFSRTSSSPQSKLRDGNEKNGADLPPLGFTAREVDTVGRLPITVTLGYIIPLILTAVPFEDTNTRQRFMALWQAFPLWVYLFDFVLSSSAPVPSHLALKQRQRSALESAYSFALWTARLSHVSTIVALGLSYMNVSPFAGLFDLESVWLPQNCFSSMPVEDLAQGMRTFLQYDQYIGSTANILWVMTLLRLVTPERTMGVARFIRLFLEAGPAGMFVGGMRERDRLAL